MPTAKKKNAILSFSSIPAAHTTAAAAAVSLYRWLTLYAVTCDKPDGVEERGGGGRKKRCLHL